MNEKQLIQNSILAVKKNDNSLNKNKKLLIIIFFIIVIIFLIKSASDSNYFHNNLGLKKRYQKKEFTDDINFDYINYERNIITDKMIQKTGWQNSLEPAYFINGIIRKFKPKKCLEIGVANGGSSILILNAIKDIKDSFLISMDLNTQMFLKSELKTGYRVKKYFPELSKKWRLFTGDLPHKFLVKLNETFDFLFLDTAHLAPGELLNLIEVLPFLKEKAIIILHDILWHFYTNLKINPSNVYLFSNLRGDKIILKNNKGSFDNIGGIFLHPNQDKYYINYFLLLLCPWEYIPTDRQINDMKSFIKKYYKNNLYLQIFEYAVMMNKLSIKKILNSSANYRNERYKYYMKSLGNNVKNMTI